MDLSYLANQPIPNGTEDPMAWETFFSPALAKEEDHAETSTYAQVIHQTIDFVRHHFAQHDGSHDWHHVERVWNLAKYIAHHENIVDEKQRFFIEVAALLHDVEDAKYRNPNESNLILNFLTSRETLSAQDIATIQEIIHRVSYSSELKQMRGIDTQANIVLNDTPEQNQAFHLMLGCVQDADRLDAIGAIGIARCFTYGGVKHRALYRPDVPPGAYDSHDRDGDSATLNHFYEKLFHIKDKIKTSTGKHIAQERHAFMKVYVQQFMHELKFKKSR